MEDKNEPQKKLDIRTMAKDIAKLKEGETNKQRDKIVQLQPEIPEQKISDVKKVETEKISQEKEEIKKKLEATVNIQKIEEDRKKQEAEEKRKLEEKFIRAEMENKKKDDLTQRIAEEQEKKKAEEIERKLKEEEKRKREQNEILRKEEEKKAREQKESELLLQKQEAEKIKSAEQAEKKLTQEEERAKLSELLNKIKSPVDRIRERMAARKIEKTVAEQKPKPEGTFFKRMPTEKSYTENKEAIAEPEQEKSPEQIMIERLQKVEAQREKERQERENFLKRVTDEKIETRPQTTKEDIVAERFPLMAKVPLKKTPLSEKVFVRIIVVGFLIGLWAIIFTFWYWATVAKKAPTATTCTPACVHGTCVATNTCTCTDNYTGPTCSAAPAPIASRSLIQVKETKSIIFETVAELKSKLEITFKDVYPEAEFRRILFGDKVAVKYLDLQKLFDDVGLTAPPAFFQKIDPADFTFFLYSKEAYNRFGMVVKIINKENIQTLLKDWEPSMEDDFNNLFTVIGKDKPAIVPYFRNGTYNGVTYRFQTFDLKDFGICYTTMDDYFILTSSLESLKKTIDLLK